MQTIALLAHLVCERGIWGPHLIIVPSSVLLNWECELKKWCPALKILTYFGSLKERKQKRIVSVSFLDASASLPGDVVAGISQWGLLLGHSMDIMLAIISCCCRDGPNAMHFMFASLHTMWQSRITELSSKRSGSTLFWMRFV